MALDLYWSRNTAHANPLHQHVAPWKLCSIGRRFTTPGESRYSPVEGEAPAVVYALHQTQYYILGYTDLIVATDHKPLLKILNDKPLTEIPNHRLLNLIEKTLPYSFIITHASGRRNSGPDAASRYPTHCWGANQSEPSDMPNSYCSASTADETGLTSGIVFPVVN